MIAVALPAAKLRAALDGTLTEIRSLFFRIDGSRPTYGPGYPPTTCAWEFTVAADGWPEVLPLGGGDFVRAPCPLGAPGALLWIRERCILPVFDDDPDQVVYAADHLDPEVARAEIQDGADGDVRWRPAICMPRWASRLAYTNRNVRVERVGDVWTWIATVERMNRPDGSPMPPREIVGGAS